MATLYTRHILSCPRKKDRNYHRCGCPLWIQHKRKRWSAGTADWAEAMKKAAALDAQTSASTPSRITVTEAIDLYLRKRSKCNDPLKAPYKDRYMLLDGSKRQMGLSAWAAKKKFIRLADISGAALDGWRDSWVFRQNSYSLKVHNAVVKKFFTWAHKFEHIERNPYDKLDPIAVEEVPTLPLPSEEFSKLLASVDAIRQGNRHTLTVLLLLMRWSGLAVMDAGCLRRDRLGSDNRLKTYRKKTGEYVHVKLPAFVADLLRAHGCINPEYFFWNGKTLPHSQVNWIERRLRKIYDKAQITPRGAHRLRDTFAVEFLNSGGTIEDLAMLLGHSSTATTWKHYAPWVKSRQQRLDVAVERSLAAQGIEQGAGLVQ